MDSKNNQILADDSSSALLIDSNSNWDTSTIQEIQFQICTRHQEEAKAFCTICNSLLCVFCMINEEPEEGSDLPILDHAHKAVNAKSYCAQSKRKWKDLHAKAEKLDQEYDKKIEELGSICSTMFTQLKKQG
jgi:NADH:ubiquinone oxidoreductase subunit F (NADH-binding)